MSPEPPKPPAAPRKPDLVQDSKLRTKVSKASPELIHHVYYDTSSGSTRRKTRREETWRRRHELGNGTFGRVWLEECEEGLKLGALRAVKEIRKSPAMAVQYDEELEAMAKFSNEKYDQCFVKSFGWYESLDTIFITMEYLQCGDLQKYLTEPFPEFEAKQIASQLAEGLCFMHDNGFAHRDLKPGNILVVNPRPEWWVKIADFGISKRAEASAAYRTFVGTEGYLAPEIYGHFPISENVSSASEDTYTRAVDIWALGEIIVRMLAQRPAFPSIRMLSAYARHEKPFPRDIFKNISLSDECHDFIEKAMCPSALRRLKAPDALAHTWLEASRPSSSGSSRQSISLIDSSSRVFSPSSPSGFPSDSLAYASWTTPTSSSALPDGSTRQLLMTNSHETNANELSSTSSSGQPELPNATPQLGLDNITVGRIPEPDQSSRLSLPSQADDSFNNTKTPLTYRDVNNKSSLHRAKSDEQPSRRLSAPKLTIPSISASLLMPNLGANNISSDTNPLTKYADMDKSETTEDINILEPTVDTGTRYSAWTPQVSANADGDHKTSNLLGLMTPPSNTAAAETRNTPSSTSKHVISRGPEEAPVTPGKEKYKKMPFAFNPPIRGYRTEEAPTSHSQDQNKYSVSGFSHSSMVPSDNRLSRRGAPSVYENNPLQNASSAIDLGQSVQQISITSSFTDYFKNLKQYTVTAAKWNLEPNTCVYLPPEEVHSLIEACADEYKLRSRRDYGLFWELPVGADLEKINNDVRTAINLYLHEDKGVKFGYSLTVHLKMQRSETLIGMLRWCWERVPGGVVGWAFYENFCQVENAVRKDRGSFNAFIQSSAHPDAKIRVILSFLDLLMIVARDSDKSFSEVLSSSGFLAWWAFAPETKDHFTFSSGLGGYKKASKAAAHLFAAYLRSNATSTTPTAWIQPHKRMEYPPRDSWEALETAKHIRFEVRRLSPTPMDLLLEFGVSVFASSSLDDVIEPECIKRLRRISESMGFEETYEVPITERVQVPRTGSDMMILGPAFIPGSGATVRHAPTERLRQIGTKEVKKEMKSNTRQRKPSSTTSLSFHESCWWFWQHILSNPSNAGGWASKNGHSVLVRLTEPERRQHDGAKWMVLDEFETAVPDSQGHSRSKKKNGWLANLLRNAREGS